MRLFARGAAARAMCSHLGSVDCHHSQDGTVDPT
jgi:hypothetical protein